MEASEAKKIIDACNERNINYQVITMMPTFITKNEHTIVKVVGENVIGFRKPLYSQNNNVGGIELLMMPAEQLCELHINANYDDMKELCAEIGIDLDSDELNTLIHIDKFDSQIEPETGDYNRFRYITGKAYDLLTDEQKVKYNQAKEAYEESKKKKLGQNQAGSISMY